MSDESTKSSDLIDVSRLTLADLDDMDESAFAHALRRLLAAGDDELGPISRFSQNVTKSAEPFDQRTE